MNINFILNVDTNNVKIPSDNSYYLLECINDNTEFKRFTSSFILYQKNNDILTFIKQSYFDDIIKTPYVKNISSKYITLFQPILKNQLFYDDVRLFKKYFKNFKFESYFLLKNSSDALQLEFSNDDVTSSSLQFYDLDLNLIYFDIKTHLNIMNVYNNIHHSYNTNYTFFDYLIDV